MKVRAYTMTVNVNHAPHVGDYEGRPLLTLANCKPGIREKAAKGEWVAAITPKKMGYRLAYLMRVDGDWTRADYWGEFEGSRLDSIYRPGRAGRFDLLDNPFHGSEQYDTDTSCNRVLRSDEFYYFAEPYGHDDDAPTGLKLPPKYGAFRRSMRTYYGYHIEIPDDFLRWVKSQPGRLRRFSVHAGDGRRPCHCCRPRQRPRCS